MRVSPGQREEQMRSSQRQRAQVLSVSAFHSILNDLEKPFSPKRFLIESYSVRALR